MKIYPHRFVLLTLLFVFPVNTWALTLVEDGNSKCVIIIPAQALKEEISAAKDLQGYLKKISGAEIKIKTEGMHQDKTPIFIGHSNAVESNGLRDRVKKLKDDGYIIKVTSESMYLVGKDPLATRFAVFGLLEDHLGVRWYMPGDIGEVVPNSKDVIFNEGEDVQEPFFPMRWIGSGDWALRNRMNVNVNKDYGLQVYGIFHTFRKFVPVEIYFNSHPEYFAMIDGIRKRTPQNQLETSNRELIHLISKKIFDIFRDKPGIDIIVVGPNDGLNFSESPESKSLDDKEQKYTVEDVNKRWNTLGPEKYGVLSRRMTIFYDDISKLVENFKGEKYVMAGAYSAYRTPPKDINLKAQKNSIIQITHFDCHDAPLETSKCNEIYRKSIDGWLKIYPNFSIYEYYWKASANELPYPIIHSIREDIPYLYKKGCFGLFTQYSSKNVGTIGLNYYIASRLLWNAKLDVDKLLADFYQKFYGPAWEPIKKYYETLENAVIDSKVVLPAEYCELPIIFNKKVIDNCKRFLNQAKLILDGNNIYSKRFDMLNTSFEYLRLSMEYLNSLQNVLNKLRWKAIYLTNLNELERLKDLANGIRNYINGNSEKNCFHFPLSSYVQSFLEPINAIRRVACGGDINTLNKVVYEEKKNKTIYSKVIDNSITETVDIWIYGNDFDWDQNHTEHEIYMIDKFKNKVKIANIGSPNEKNGDNKNLCYVVKVVNINNFISNGIVEIQITNPVGYWRGSTLFAVYIMPHNNSINGLLATTKLEKNLEEIREQSFAFKEYCNFGVKIIDGGKTETELKIVSNVRKIQAP